MITKALLQKVRSENSKFTGPIKPSNMPKIKVDMRGILGYAREKGISVNDLTDDERAMFASSVN